MAEAASAAYWRSLTTFHEVRRWSGFSVAWRALPPDMQWAFTTGGEAALADIGTGLELGRARRPVHTNVS